MKQFKVCKSFEVQVSTLIDADCIEDAEQVADYMSFSNPKWKIEHTEYHYSGSIEEIVNGIEVPGSYQPL